MDDFNKMNDLYMDDFNKMYSDKKMQELNVNENSYRLGKIANYSRILDCFMSANRDSQELERELDKYILLNINNSIHNLNIIINNYNNLDCRKKSNILMICITHLMDSLGLVLEKNHREKKNG